MARTSAGLLPYRLVDGRVQVFIAHPGGPLWARRDEGAWTVVKGEYTTEDPRQAAAREFREEIGVPAPGGDWLELPRIRQRSGKIVTAFAVEMDELTLVASNTVDLEWPRGSGRVISFPEVDRAQWFDLDDARSRLVAGQADLLDALLAALTATGRLGDR